MGRILMVDAAEIYRQMIRKKYLDSICAISIDDARKKVSALKAETDLSLVVMEITGITTMDSSLADFVKDIRARQEQYLPIVAFTNASALEAALKTQGINYDGLFSKRNYPQMFDTLKLLLSHPEHYKDEKIVKFSNREIPLKKDLHYRHRPYK